MIVSDKISIHRIVSTTWKHFLFNILTCAGFYLLHLYVLGDNISIPSLVPTVLGTALAFFIGFNNNQAYD